MSATNQRFVPQASTYHFNLTPKQVAPVETEFRRIHAPLPHPEDIKVIETIMRYESSLAGRQLPIVWDRAEGFQVYDRWGNRWIDLSSTIFVTNAGHANRRARARLAKVVEKGLLHAYSYPTVERAEFLEKLVAATPSYLGCASLTTTGTETSERAIKLARCYGMKFSPRRKVIIGGLGNFHGKTMGAMMSAVTPKAREWIGNQDPDMHQMPFPYPWELESAGRTGAQQFERDLNALFEKGVKADEVAAFIIESYQGWGAVFYPTDYVQAMAQWAKQNQTLMIADEIQSGFGRTGRLFGYQRYDIEPDLVCCGKGVSGNLPLSALLGRRELIELDSTLTSTHGGHPAACAAASGNLETLIEDGLVERGSKLGELCYQWLLEWQAQFPDRIKKILGSGMVWAVLICKPGTEELDAVFVDRLVERAMEKGVFSIRTGCGSVKLGPPLCIAEAALKEAVGVYVESMRELLSEGH